MSHFQTYLPVRTIAATLALLFMLAILPVPALAQNGGGINQFDGGGANISPPQVKTSPQPGASGPGLQNPLKYGTFPQFLAAVLDVIATLALPFLVLFFVFIGFKFVLAQGKPEELTKVKQYFMWALVGALLILGASILARALEGTVEQIRQGTSAVIINLS